MSNIPKSIHDKHAFIEMLMNLNLKLHNEVEKRQFVLPAGTVIVFQANDIDKLEIIIPPSEEDQIRTLEQIDNDIQQLFENALLLPKKRRGRPRKTKDLIDKAIEIFDSESKASNHPVYDI
jgi:hypothetical protein